jgi:two-component system sensor histidine kinase/response regulator
MTGHVPEFGGHDAETVGHDAPKYAIDVVRDQITASSGSSVDALQRERFHCVLMDVQMPVMDGLEAVRRIRANPLVAATPVLALTANASDADRQLCLAAGMDDFVTKPVISATLYAMLARWRVRRSTGPAGASAAAVAEPSAR